MIADHRFPLLLTLALTACGGLSSRAPLSDLPAGDAQEAAVLISELPPWDPPGFEHTPEQLAHARWAWLTTGRTLVGLDLDAVRDGMAHLLDWTARHEPGTHEQLDRDLFALNRLLFAIPPTRVEPDRTNVGWKRIPPSSRISHRSKPLLWPVIVDEQGRVIGLHDGPEPSWYRPLEEFDDFRARFPVRAPGDFVLPTAE